MKKILFTSCLCLMFTFLIGTFSLRSANALEPEKIEVIKNYYVNIDKYYCLGDNELPGTENMPNASKYLSCVNKEQVPILNMVPNCNEKEISGAYYIFALDQRDKIIVDQDLWGFDSLEQFLQTWWGKYYKATKIIFVRECLEFQGI